MTQRPMSGCHRAPCALSFSAVCAVLLAGRFFCSRVAMSSSSDDDELMMSKGFFMYAILWEARAVFKLYFCTVYSDSDTCDIASNLHWKNAVYGTVCRVL